MSLPKETVDRIAELGASEAGAVEVEFVDPRKRVFIQAGQILEVLVGPACEMQEIATAYDLAAFLTARGRPARVLVSQTSVRALLDPEDRRDMAYMDLCRSARFNALFRLEEAGGKSFSQSALLTFLRHELDIDEARLAPWRKLEFKQTQAGSRNIQKGEDSLGKSADAQVRGTDKLPDDITVRLSVFEESQAPSEAEVKVLIDVDPFESTIFLKPRADDVTRALWRARLQVAEYLIAETPDDVLVYQGS